MTSKMQCNEYLDYRVNNRYWGHDFKLSSKLDKEGYLWEIAIFSKKSPCKNMFILLGLNSNDVRVGEIKKVKACGNPSDMYFIMVKIGGSEKFFKLQDSLQPI